MNAAQALDAIAGADQRHPLSAQDRAMVLEWQPARRGNGDPRLSDWKDETWVTAVQLFRRTGEFPSYAAERLYVYLATYAERYAGAMPTLAALMEARED